MEPVGITTARHTQLIELSLTDKDFIAVSEEVSRTLSRTGCACNMCDLFFVCKQVQNTICEHRDDGRAGGVFKSYEVVKVSAMRGASLAWVPF